MSNGEVAHALVISGHTVHRHVANVLGKLVVSSRAAAVARAARLDLLSSGSARLAEKSPWPVRAISLRARNMARTGEAVSSRPRLNGACKP
jgi:hypothetical protein